MTRLTDLMNAASAPRDGWALDPSELVEAGEQRMVHRSRRRRTFVAIAAAAAVIAVVVIPRLVDPDDRSSVVEPGPVPPGTYRDVPLHHAEMERRCSIILNQRNGTNVRYVAGRSRDGTAIPSGEATHEVETREGWAVQLKPEGEHWEVGHPLTGSTQPSATLTPAAARALAGHSQDVCVIPQRDRIAQHAEAPQNVPRPHDRPAIIAACSQRTGYDFSGWQVLAATEMGDMSGGSDPLVGIDAMLLSNNGHAARCWVAESGSSGIAMIPRRYLDSRGKPLFLPADTNPTDRFAVVAPKTGEIEVVGIVPGLPDRWRIDIVGAGWSTTVATDRGGFAYRVPGPIHTSRWFITVHNRAGTLVWKGHLEGN